MRTIIVAICLCGTHLTQLHHAYANDAEYSNYGGNPVPIKNNTIRMVSENIVFKPGKKFVWKVSATYVFQNTSNKRQSLTIGYPEFKGDGQEQLDNESFLGLQTSVRGIPIKTSAKTPDNAQLKNHAEVSKLTKRNLGRVHLFNVTFTPNETIEINHTFHYNGGGSIALAFENTLEYVTRTGALWHGPIGEANFTIHTNEVYELIAFSKELHLLSKKHTVLKPGIQTGMVIQFQMKNWTPKGDFRVDLVKDYDHALRKNIIQTDCPDSNRTDVASLSLAQLKLCRNWIYARYGYPFRTQAMRARFYGKVHIGWYPPQYRLGDNHDLTSKRKMSPLALDPNFSINMLSAEEQQQIQALLKEEKRRKKQILSNAYKKTD